MGQPLTDALLRAIKPSAKRVAIADLACRGLSLRVTPAGAKSFAFRYRPRGGKRIERVTIGAYPDVSLRDARARADKLRRQVADGENPSARRREAPTRSFAALADRYLREHARRFKRSADKDERNLRLHMLPRWGDWDFARITRADVIALVERLISDGKPTLANHVQRLVSKIFAFAMDAALAEQIRPPACACAASRGSRPGPFPTTRSGSSGRASARLRSAARSASRSSSSWQQGCGPERPPGWH